MTEGGLKGERHLVATDQEIAEYWGRHLAAPCNPGPGRENEHVGSVNLREARRELASMLAKSVENQDKQAINDLQRAIELYIELNGE